MQIRHCFLKISYGHQNIQAPAWSFLTSPTLPQKGITMFYNIHIQQKCVFTKYPPYMQWEADLGQSFMIHQWNKACKATQKATCYSTLWKLTTKISLRWYLTPDKISRYSPQLCNRCWRNCGQKGDILHVLWDCPALSTYWNAIFNIISEITQQQVPMTPGIAILSLGIDSLPPTYNYPHTPSSKITNHVKVEKKTLPPSLTEVIDLTHLYCSYNQMMATCLGRLQISLLQ